MALPLKNVELHYIPAEYVGVITVGPDKVIQIYMTWLMQI